MTPRHRVRAVITLGAYLVLLGFEAALLAVARSTEALSGGESLGGFAIGLIVVATSAGSVGLFLSRRVPGNPIGSLLVGGPLVLIGGFLAFGFAMYRALTLGLDPVGGAAAAIGAAAVTPGITLSFAGVALLFPDGHLPGRRWLIPTRAVVAIIGFGSLLALLSSDPASGMAANPFAVVSSTELASLASAIEGIGMIGALVLALAAVSVRVRRAHGVERQQLKWFLAAVAANAIVLPPAALTEAGPSDLLDFASFVAATLLPMAIGIAIVRYRLYQIDTIVNRALVYAAVTAILAGLMAAAVALTKGFFATLFGQATDLSLIVSTVVVVATFEPIKKVVQTAVDRYLKPVEPADDRLAAFVAGLDRFVGVLDPDRTLRSYLAEAVAAFGAAGGSLSWSDAEKGGVHDIRVEAKRLGTRQRIGTDAIVAQASRRPFAGRLDLRNVETQGNAEAIISQTLEQVFAQLAKAPQGAAMSTAAELRELPDAEPISTRAASRSTSFARGSEADA